MKLVLFGGTFDPVHQGHTEIINHLGTVFQETIVIPAGIPPHKKGSIAEHRLNMLRLATTAEIDRTEIDEGTSYTYITLERYKKMRGVSREQLYFCIGSDSLLNILSWKNPKQIFDTASLYVIPRPNFSEKNMADFLRAQYGANILVSSYVGEDISSTELRIRAAFSDFSRLNDDVANYIKTHKLYFSAEAAALAEFGLSPSRITHTLNTALMAAELAERNFCDKNDAIRAAILHDIGKSTSAEDAIKAGFVSKDSGILSLPQPVQHGYISAGIAKKRFNASEDAQNAIKYHTTARPNMSLLEKVVFAADHIEIGRSFLGADIARQETLANLDRGIVLILKGIIEHLHSQGIAPHPSTLNAYNQYIEE